MPKDPRSIVGLFVASALGLAASAEPVRIACIGDSITQGSGLANASLESYPARLQRLLGTNAFTVRNYGVSGRTLLKKGDYPYWRESAYTQSRNWQPKVVLIKLGTNDSKPYNWRHGTNFVAEYEEFIASYTNLDSRPRVILCTPAPVYRTGAFDIQPATVANEIAPAVRDLAARLGLEVIDYHERLAGHPEWFPDTVHPNTRGMAVLAAIAWQTLGVAPPAPSEPRLALQPLSGGRAQVDWPADRAAMVLQSANTPAGPESAWTVLDSVPYTDGSHLHLTNRPTNPRFYRLWQP